MARLSDALVTRALRHHLDSGQEPGWLRGLRDPFIARALAALHGDLSTRWTVESLARTAGLSRSAFAARFTRLVGRAPMDYLFRCRMLLAMKLLRDEKATVANVAGQVGYGSEAACRPRSSGTTERLPAPIGAGRREFPPGTTMGS